MEELHLTSLIRAHGAVLAAALGGALLCLGDGAVAATIALHGASQFDAEHAVTRTLVRFQELVEQYYDGPEELEFVLHLDSELGIEKDYFAHMSQGISVDYAVVAPAHLAVFSPMAALLDMPLLFRDLEHWNKVLEGDALRPIAADVADQADVMLIGYAGGGTRNVIGSRPVETLDDVQGLPIRVRGAPIQTRIFEALSMAPTVLTYADIYHAIQNGVIDAAENEAAGIEQMRFYEVGPHVVKTAHAITVRPLCFSGKTFRRLPADLQAAILRAGREAAAYGRAIKASGDAEKLARMAADGLLTIHEFRDRERLLELAEPVKAAYAEELGALAVYEAVKAAR